MQSDHESDGESGSFFHQHFPDQEQWYDAWTEELVTTYHILKDHCDFPANDHQRVET
jgi:hypothetical protein